MNNNLTNRNFSENSEESSHRRERHSRSGGWVGGIVLIGLGVVFLLQTQMGLALTNWWALFILFPIMGAFANAWKSYQDAGGNFTFRMAVSIVGGLILIGLTVALLLNLFINWGLLGPALLILAGIGILSGIFTKR